MPEAPSSLGDAHPPEDDHGLVEALAAPVRPPRPPQRKAGADAMSRGPEARPPQNPWVLAVAARPPWGAS
jgi:hypothetical protein